MEQKKPKKAITIFLISSTMLLSLALFGCGIYSLYISIGFRFLSRSTLINTSPLLTYSNSVYGTGAGTMIGLILISIVMLALGVAMAVIFFKQLPLYKQIKLVRKLPSVKYKDYTKQAKKGVIVISIIAYVVCIAFSVFAIITAVSSGVSPNYLWAIVGSYALVLALSIASMVLMIAKIVQLSKIKKSVFSSENMQQNEQILPSEESAESNNNLKSGNLKQYEYIESSEQQPQIDIVSLSNPEPLIAKQEKPKADKLFSDGIFELGEQLQKLREMHISGLIDAEEYTLIREKWIDAVLSVPLFGKKQPRANKKTIKEKTVVQNLTNSAL